MEENSDFFRGEVLSAIYIPSNFSRQQGDENGEDDHCHSQIRDRPDHNGKTGHLPPQLLTYPNRCYRDTVQDHGGEKQANREREQNDMSDDIAIGRKFCDQLLSVVQKLACFDEGF
jgi:hypothetical protein